MIHRRENSCERLSNVLASVSMRVPVYQLHDRFQTLVLRLSVLSLVAAATMAHAADTVIEIAPPAAQSNVPRWDARGLGPLPWQGIACLDMSDDGRSIVVGTIAPQGDSNLVQLDGDGKIVGQYIAGQRWVNEVAVSNDGRFVAGLCTTPEGTSGDVPRLYGFLNGKEVDQIGGNFKSERISAPICAFWHYGDHSNHLPRILLPGRQSLGDRGRRGSLLDVAG